MLYTEEGVTRVSTPRFYLAAIEKNEDSQNSRAGGHMTQVLEKIVLTDKPGGVEYVPSDHCSSSCIAAHLSGTSPPPDYPAYMVVGGEGTNNTT